MHLGRKKPEIFENKITPNIVLTDRVYRLVAECGRYAGCIYKQEKHRIPNPNVWQAPPNGGFELNTQMPQY